MREGRNRLALVAVTLLMALTLSACGGGSGGGSSSASNGGSGRVSVLLTDAPTTKFDAVKVTITSIELLGDGSPITVSDRTRTVDLLHLSGVADLFSTQDNVPAGTYDKIRLHVSRVDLIWHDQNGNTVSHTAKLPANGKIDLNPRQPFRVTDGATLAVELDVDAEKSIHLVQTGSGKYIFRPVVFVNVVGAGTAARRLVRIHGTVQNLDSAAQRFTLCPTQVVSSDNTSERDFDASAHCTAVESASDTGFFDPSGDPSTLAQVADGDELTAVGTLQHLSDSERRAQQDDMTLKAAVVEMGPVGTFTRLGGTTQTTVSSDNRFDLSLSAGQGYGTGTTLPVALQPGTHIYSRDARALKPSDVQAGMAARVDGVVTLSNSQPDLIKSALVVLKTSAENQESGVIQSVAPATRNLTVTVTGQGDSCIHAVSDARILRINNGTSEAIALGDLQPGDTVDTILTYGGGG